MTDCPTCWGNGRVANTADQESWSAWESLPLANAAAVVMGLIKPIPCSRCRGTGQIGVHCDSCTCEPAGEGEAP